MAVKAPSWRPMTWVVLAFNALMVVWLVSGLASVADTDCDAEHPKAPALSADAAPAQRARAAQAEIDRLNLVEACEAGTAVGAGIGVAFIVFVWVAGDVVLGVIWLVTRKPAAAGRACPVCGTPVAVGQVVCSSCGYDYRTAQQGAIPEPPPIWPPPGVTERRRS